MLLQVGHKCAVVWAAPRRMAEERLQTKIRLQAKNFKTPLDDAPA
jgi:hypothetical protein